MIAYPQLATGAASQYPVKKTRTFRTAANIAPDGTYVKFPDSGAELTEWQLQYSELNDEEIETLLGFFVSAEGSLNGFTFLDPVGNLLAWTEDFTAPCWEKSPLLAVAGGVTDYAGGARAWRVTNPAAGAQALQQAIEAPAEFRYCFSAYVRAQQSTPLTLLCGPSRKQITATPTWSRVVLSTGSGTNGDSIQAGVELPPGGSIELFGPQVEAQAGASGYRRSQGQAGVYPGAHFRDDEFTHTTSDVNRHSCTVNIIHAKHL